jgi:peptidoglycan/LPS O-acetylase OafA/YrhL
LLLSTCASAPLGVLLAGLAARLRAGRRDHVPVLATVALIVAAADLLSVVPFPGAEALGLGYFATVPLLGLIGWRLTRR